MVDGPNLYLYCGNNPVNWVDPEGMCIEKGKEGWEWYLHESVLPGPYGQPISELGPEGSTSWGDPMKYTEEAGGAWMWAERGAMITSASAAFTAGGLAVGGKNLELALRLSLELATQTPEPVPPVMPIPTPPPITITVP